MFFEKDFLVIHVHQTFDILKLGRSPFEGIKDSGLGVKEGVIEAMKCFTFVKTFSMPW